MAAAYAALASLMHTIHEIEHHHSPPISLDKQQAQSLTQNITFLQGFLESYNPPVPNDESADQLEMHIADAAYAAEDVIESHIVDTIPRYSRIITDNSHSNTIHSPDQKIDNSHSNTIHSPDQKIAEQNKSTNFNKNLQQAIEEMDSVKKIAMTIDTKKMVVPAVSVIASSSTGPSSITVVGFDDASLQIMEKLTEDRPDLQVIPIAGMGGIGKTTLARKVYEKKLIKEHFYICAWATISQQYNTRETLSEVYSQVTENDKKQLSEAELGLKLHKYLSGRRFLIVMDDMWSIDAWNEVQHFFPNNQNGSRVLVTTRLLELSSLLNNDYIHQVGFLDEASSWDLFSKTVFGDENICPRELKKVGKKIVDGCRGLPLSIAVVGGLLKNMDATELCWESIGRNLTSVVNLENDKHCLRLLRLSYNHLPVHLKPCFLYVGVFEEDAEISVSTLVELWISEGFLKPMNGESLVKSAKGFLRDLVDRNLVLINKLGSTGKIKSCKIHDLLRDLCLKEGQKGGLYHVIGQRSPRCINRQRRIFIPRNDSLEIQVLGDFRSIPHARSFIFENIIVKVPDCSNLRLLRTFHADFISLEGVSFTEAFTHQHVNLRCLNIKGKYQNLSSCLSSVSLLWNLHTIIVSYPRNPSILTIPEIWKMPQLRRIEFDPGTLCLPDPPSVDDDAMIIMENLQVLKGLRDFKCCREVVKRIPNIKKLKIRFFGIMENKGISNFELLFKLESLYLRCKLNCSGSPYLHNTTFPHSLKRLSLDFEALFEWKESMLKKIGSLPFLEKLSLTWGFFEKPGRWEIVEGQFPCLKYLSLYLCHGLEQWTAAEEGSSIFPCLEQIFLHGDLKSIPREIGNIPTLQKIRIETRNEEAIKSVKEMVDEQVELQGDQLPFSVEAIISWRQKNMMKSLSGPNFVVKCGAITTP